MAARQIIPKEQLTAYERWEMSDFGGPQTSRARADRLPTVAAIEQIQAQAREEGYVAGRNEGYAAGLAQAAAEARNIHNLLQPLAASLKALDEEIAEDVLGLALHVAREVIRDALATKPELMLPVVREAIRSFDSFNAHPQLILNPGDAELVRMHLADQLQHGGWKLREDPTLQRGGCRVETHSAEADATLGTRWTRVIAALGQDVSWLGE